MGLLSKFNKKTERVVLESIDHKNKKRFSDIEEIDKGSQGRVFKARDAGRGNEEVAVKVGSKNPELRKLYSIEHTIMKHGMEGIVKSHDFGQFTNSKGEIFPYFVMELASVDLRKFIRNNGTENLPLDVKVKMFEDVAKGLTNFHKKKFPYKTSGDYLIHRDLKPSNILLFDEDESITAKIGDFGVIAVQGGSTSLKGDLNYIAPEMQHDRSKGDSRADIYPLGLILYEVLSGSNPIEKIRNKSRIDADDIDIPQVQKKLFEIKTKELDPAKLDYSGFEKFKYVIQKCIDPKPENRLGSAEVVLNELRWAKEHGRDYISLRSRAHKLGEKDILAANEVSELEDKVENLGSGSVFKDELKSNVNELYKKSYDRIVEDYASKMKKAVTPKKDLLPVRKIKNARSIRNEFYDTLQSTLDDETLDSIKGNNEVDKIAKERMNLDRKLIENVIAESEEIIDKVENSDKTFDTVYVDKKRDKLKYSKTVLGAWKESFPEYSNEF